MTAPNMNPNFKFQSVPEPKKPPGVGIRFAAWLVDYLFVIAITSLAVILHVRSEIFSYAVWAIAILVVTVGPLLMSNQSLGKKIFKLKVIPENGDLLSLPQVLLREILFKNILLIFLPLALCGFLNGALHNGLLAIACTIGVYAIIERLAKKQQAFFWDKLCKTQVEYAE
jgi:uncharacterized RDD family membrane protein YckC